jgi:hypothetical protein
VKDLRKKRKHGGKLGEKQYSQENERPRSAYAVIRKTWDL